MIATGRASSPLEAAVARVGERWTLLVVDALLRGSSRFGELQADVAGIAPNVLSQRLKHLEHEGLIVAEPYSRRPPRFSYRLTAAGAELGGALRLLAQWGARGTDADGLRHEACGTTLEARWYCPTCSRAVDEPAEQELRYV